MQVHIIKPCVLQLNECHLHDAFLSFFQEVVLSFFHEVVLSFFHEVVPKVSSFMGNPVFVYQSQQILILEKYMYCIKFADFAKIYVRNINGFAIRYKG